MAILMCKNARVYDLKKREILNPALMPVLDQNNLESWLLSRNYVDTNRVAETTVMLADTIDKRINRRRFSLSDCYWVVHDNEYIENFDDVSPYKNDFFSGSAFDVNAKDNAKVAPDRVLGGTLPKEWARLNNETGFFKYMSTTQVYSEMLALSLAHKLGVDSCRAYADIIKSSEENADGETVKTVETVASDDFTPDMKVDAPKIFIVNMTDEKNMLMSSDALLGEETLKPDKGHDAEGMISLYMNVFDKETAADFVIRTLMFDVIVCNYDRNANKYNWGYFKDSETGEVSPAPLYDFNVARTVPPKLMTMKKIIAGISRRDKLRDIALKYLRKWSDGVDSFGVHFWADNCRYVIDILKTTW